MKTKITYSQVRVGAGLARIENGDFSGAGLYGSNPSRELGQVSA
ncbi:MAG: hypothetical protein ACJ746_03455 [Bryobacteraceae bacterium]